MKKIAIVLVFVLVLSVVGCVSSSSDAEKVIEPAIVGSLFVEGCPIPGLSSARMVTSPFFGVEGPDGLGTVGDYLLMNDKAAFVIQGPGNVNTYYYYSGLPIDAVALNGCEQAGPEQFQEMGMMLGNVDLTEILAGNYDNLFLRTFRGDRAEVISDGSDGGPAIVRVHGEDDIFWLTEVIFVSELGIEMSQPQGVDIYVDYILDPDSSVLQMEFNIHNRSGIAKKFLAGVALFFGNTTVPLKKSPALSLCLPPGIDIGGISGCLDAEVMWMVQSRGDGAWAFSMKDANMATVNISGVDAVLNGNQLVEPIEIPDGGTARVPYFLSVGGGDYNTALVPLQDYIPSPALGLTYTRYPFEGTAYDIASGDPVPDALVEVYVQIPKEFIDVNIPPSTTTVWLDGFISDENGRFSGSVPKLDLGCPVGSAPGTCPIYAVVASANARPGIAPIPFNPSMVFALDIGFSSGGVLDYDITDATGRNIPVKIILWEPGTSNMRHRIYTATGLGTEEIVAGNYDVSVTRGIEYSTYQGNIDIMENQVTSLQVALQRPVDTTGYLSVDTHIHAGPSADNYISIPERVRTIAAEGLEVAVSTDHENVVSWQFGIDENNLNAWIGYVLGEEVSPEIPGHHNIYPIEAWNDINKRGYPVPWWLSKDNPGYSMDIQEMHAAFRARGAEIIQVNHPRATGMFGVALYNRMTGVGDEIPVNMAQPAGADVWDWDFDAFEYINGGKDVFIDPTEPDRSGLFEDWMSFLNLGYPKTALGASDAHNYQMPGYPRNYFPSSTDEPGQFNQDELVQAILSGKAVVSTGAFARVDINGVAGMGEEVMDGDGTVDLNIHIEAIPEIDVAGFLVFVNCDQAASVAATDPNGVVKYDGVVPLTITEDSHVVVLGFGLNNLPRGLDNFRNSVPRFTTNAIFVDYDGGGYTPPGAKSCMAPQLPWTPPW